MSSGFPGGYPADFFNGNLIGKRSLTHFQHQHQFNQQPSDFLRNVKPRVSSLSNFSSVNQQVDRKMLNRRLQELEKELLLDDDEQEVENDAVSVVTHTEFSDTIQKLLNPVQVKKPGYRISPSPTTSSSSSSCASSCASVSPKQLISDAAEAITDGKSETAMELITRLNQYSNARGTPEQRIGCYIASALRQRVKPTVEAQSSSATELYKKEHILSTQLLYDKSPCFKLAFMTANNLILETLSGSGQPGRNMNLHVVDFDIGHGLQYVYLIHEIAASRKAGNGIVNGMGNGMPVVSLKLTTFKDFGNGGVERLKVVCEGLKSLSNKLGVCFDYNVLEFKLSEISKQGLAIENDDVLAVNFAFKLNKFPDESVSTENVRDALLRRVKGMSPAVVTVAEQDLNTNTASFTARVNDVFSYYTAFVDSFDATVTRESVERVKIEEGLSRRIVNSVACEGKERVERCEVFGKWRARMRMAGFGQNPVSQVTVDSLMSKVKWGTRGNPGFTVKEDLGGVSFGWLGRSLTVVSAWQ